MRALLGWALIGLAALVVARWRRRPSAEAQLAAALTRRWPEPGDDDDTWRWGIGGCP